MNQFLSGVDRTALIKGTSIYLMIYALLNSCGGIRLTLLGRFAESVNLAELPTDSTPDANLIAMSRVWDAFGDFALVVGVAYLVSVPVFAAVAWGLWNWKRWARTGAILALGFTFVLSGMMLFTGNTVDSLLWMLISGVGIYLYWSDTGIQQQLSQ